MRKKIGMILALLLIILLLSGTYVYRALKTSGKTGTFVVKEGIGTRSVFSQLVAEGYLYDENVALLYSHLFHNASFKAGEYEIASPMSLSSLIDYLGDSRNAVVKDVKVTFPEGTWLKNYAKKIAAVTNLDEKDLLAYWEDREVLKNYLDKYPFLPKEILNTEIRHPLEGYFFPDTYLFYKETTPEEVTKKLLDNTASVVEKLSADLKESKLSLHEVFTLASIVQYEAASTEDMKNIASVFYNRLAINMPLQSSVTVCYALDLADGDSWKSCEYNPDYESEYNTYLHQGLPPGPILNPGEEALKAVLHPNKTNYYYFMANVCGDGKVYYAETLAEHEANVEEYLTCY